MASAINLVGLSIAIGCAIVVYLMVHSQLTLNASHEHADRIYSVHHVRQADGKTQTWAGTPEPMGPILEREFPQIEQSVRVETHGVTVHRGGTKFDEWMRFVDAAFLDLFTYPLAYGSGDVLKEPGSVILSEATATKYFGDENPVGQAMTISFGEDQIASFTVGAVAEPFPANDGLGFRILANYDKQRDLSPTPRNEWARLTQATFVRVEPPSAVDDLSAQLDRFVPRYNTAEPNEPIVSFSMASLRNLSKNTGEVRGSIVASASTAEVVMFSCLAIFLLLLACVNYVNISLSTATRRLKEIGIRKVVGTTRRNLIVQFLTENVVLCFLSLVVGTLLAYSVLVPVVSDMINSDLGLHLGDRIDIWLFLVGLLAALGIASGSYPAFYVSSFQPVTIFRGEKHLGRQRLFMQSLFTFQFVLAFVTVASSVVFMRNYDYLTERDWGYSPENTIAVRLEDDTPFDVLHRKAAETPSVISITGARHHLKGGGEPHRTVEVDGERMETAYFEVGPRYLETVRLRLSRGMGLSAEAPTEAIVINEAFAEKQNWSEPIGKSVRLDTVTAMVAGVVRDFHYDSFFEEIDPVVLRLANPSNYGYLVMRVEDGTVQATVDHMQAAWNDLAPDEPFDYFFQEDVFDGFYRANRQLSNTITFVAFIALLISCMGLFGLVSQHIGSRMKEISVRKVLGASLSRVALSMNRRFIGLVLLAALIATPLSYYLLDTLLDAVYTYRTDLGITSFLIAYGLIFTTGLLTVSSQVYRLAVANPADILRDP